MRNFNFQVVNSENDDGESLALNLTCILTIRSVLDTHKRGDRFVSINLFVNISIHLKNRSYDDIYDLVVH